MAAIFPDDRSGIPFDHAVVSFPLLYRTVRASFAAIDRDLLGAARTLGISELHVF